MEKPKMKERLSRRSPIELAAIDAVTAEFQFTRRYIVDSLDGYRTGLMPDSIIKAYKAKVIAIKKAIEGPKEI